MASSKAKTKSTPKTAHARATRSAYKPAAGKTARDSSAAWKEQSTAKLYQLPFNAQEVSEATQKAAANATELWRSMWDSKNQQWSQFLSGAKKFPGFDSSVTSDQLNYFTRESGSQLTRGATAAAAALNEAFDLARENTEVLVEAGNQAVAVSKELSAELISYANRTFAQNVELSKEILSCRTLNDMFDLSGRFIKSNLDGFFSESVHLSETIFEHATGISEPLNERLTETTERLTKALAA